MRIEFNNGAVGTTYVVVAGYGVGKRMDDVEIVEFALFVIDVVSHLLHVLPDDMQLFEIGMFLWRVSQQVLGDINHKNESDQLEQNSLLQPIEAGRYR
jgi:hypothetical protein